MIEGRSGSKFHPAGKDEKQALEGNGEMSGKMMQEKWSKWWNECDRSFETSRKVAIIVVFNSSTFSQLVEVEVTKVQVGLLYPIRFLKRLISHGCMLPLIISLHQPHRIGRSSQIPVGTPKGILG